MILSNWQATLDDELEQPAWCVEHYVGGEDGWEFDDYFETKEEAYDRVEVLNKEGREFTHTDYEARGLE